MILGSLHFIPYYLVPSLFSNQHLFLLLISTLYIWGLAHLLKRKDYSLQRSVFITLSIGCAFLFAGRILWGWPDSKTTLLPLELCNINIYITFAILILQKKEYYPYLYFVSMLGALISLTIYPPVHMNVNVFTQYMFWDYYLIHTNLVAIPIGMITCGWFRPSVNQIRKTLTLLIIVWSTIFLITTALREVPPFASANYIYTYDPGTLPILSQLYERIPIPFVYQWPLIPLILLLFLVLAFPFWATEQSRVKKELKIH